MEIILFLISNINLSCWEQENVIKKNQTKINKPPPKTKTKQKKNQQSESGKEQRS